MASNPSTSSDTSPARRRRSNSFATIDEVEASGVLTDILREHEVYLGGSSIGKGFKSAARYYMRNSLLGRKRQPWLEKNMKDLAPDILQKSILEDAFYVLDLGIIVSQVYQWRKFLPRIEPFYAVKCNPDPVILKTLAIMGCHFDCASRQEMALVQDICQDLPRKPDIIYANPTKARAHIVEAVCRGVRLMTFDNVSEVVKCAQISPKIQLVLRIVTDDRGSQCRLSSKFGAPRPRWRNLLRAAQQHGLEVVGVSFHVGSGCRDASRYESALRDARDVFDMAKEEFGMTMTLLDIGGGFPGETHSVWNPADLDFFREDGAETDEKEGLEPDGSEFPSSYMFFQEIAVAVAPIIDDLFPSKSVRVIGEPGRYFVAAAATLCACIVSTRSNEVDEKTFVPDPISDVEASKYVDSMTRQDEQEHVRSRAVSRGGEDDEVLDTIVEELNDYSKLFAKQTLVQQEADVYNDALDLYQWDIDTAADLLGMPDEVQMQHQVHTVEGMTKNIVDGSTTNAEGEHHHSEGLVTLAAAGEAAINGIVMQAVADSAPLQDDYAYYINDGVYGAFNNIMFDHASVRPRVLRKVHKSLGDNDDKDDGCGSNRYVKKDGSNGFITLLEAPQSDSEQEEEDKLLFASTVFGPTCDSIDVITRSVLLPRLKVGDWLYFQNMGAYTMAAASSFNGFAPTEKMYVCSVQPEFFESLIAGPGDAPLKVVDGMPIGFVPSTTGVAPTSTTGVEKVKQEGDAIKAAGEEKKEER